MITNMSWDAQMVTWWAQHSGYRGQHRERLRSYTMDYMRQYYPVPKKRETTYWEPEDEQRPEAEPTAAH